MKNLWWAGVVVCALGLGGPVWAADAIPGPTPYRPVAVPTAPVFTWTGFYIGGNVGYGLGHSEVEVTDGVNTFSGSENLRGIVGGAQAGFNWQSGAFVLGLETDFQVTGQQHSTTFVGVETEQDKIAWFGTTRVRLGAALSRVLFYATVGAAYGEGRSEFTGVVPATFVFQRVGWAAGIGVDWAVWNGLVLRLEYLHVDTGKVDNVTIENLVFSSRFRDEIVRFGVSYLFSFGPMGGPVVARY